MEIMLRANKDEGEKLQNNQVDYFFSILNKQFVHRRVTFRNMQG